MIRAHQSTSAARGRSRPLATLTPNTRQFAYRGLNVRFTARLLVGVMIAAGGLIHWQLWREGYQGIPFVGNLFILNVVASAVVAIAVVVTADRRVAMAAAALCVASLGALVLSRTTGLLGFTESAWTPDALRAVAAEIGALAAVGVCRKGALQGAMAAPGSTS